MLLAIDVGNTNMVIGVFDANDADSELAAADAARTDLRRARVCWSRACSSTAASISRDHRHRPRIRRSAADRHDARRWWNATSADAAGRRSGTNAGMPIRYENPAEVGADRIVNAIAAYEQFGRSAAAADRLRFRHRDDARRGERARANTSAARFVPA